MSKAKIGCVSPRGRAGTWRNLVLAVAGLITALTLAACLGGTPANAPVPPTAAALSRQEILVLGEVSSDPASKFEEIAPLADYLSAQLAGAGIKKVDVVVATDLPEMLTKLQSGEVDLFFDNPHVALLASEQAGVQFLLRRWRKGISDYHVNIFARRDSGIAGLNGLLGKVVAYDSPESSYEEKVASAYLIANGYNPVLKSTADGSVAAAEIGYVYAQGEDSIVAWVLEGKTAAGVLRSDSFDGLDEAVKSQLVILAETVDLPRHIVMARAGLDAGLRARIVEVLQGMDKTPEGKAALKGFGKTDKFDALPLGADGTVALLKSAFGSVR